MNIIKVDGSFAINDNGEWLEGRYESKELAAIVPEILNKQEMAVLYLMALRDERFVICNSDFDSFCKINKN